MEMDIYMRRRLVALAILVGIIILFVLLIRSCGGDDEEAPLVGATGASGTQPISQEEYIDQADAVCAEANNSIDRIDPAAEDAIEEELQITEQALVRLQSLETPPDAPGSLNRFLRQMNRLVDGLDTLQTALERGDVEAQAAAETAITEAREKAANAAESFGFRECGEFGEPGTDSSSTEEDTGDTGAVAPETTTPPATTPVEPAPTPTPEAPADGGTGDSGGVTPPSDDSGGITP